MILAVRMRRAAASFTNFGITPELPLLAGAAISRGEAKFDRALTIIEKDFATPRPRRHRVVP